MIKLLKEFNKKDYFLIFVCSLLIVFQVWLDLKLPDYMSSITKLVQTEGSKMSDVLSQGSYMLLCAFGSLISAFIVGYLTSYISATFSQKIRKKNAKEKYSSSTLPRFTINCAKPSATRKTKLRERTERKLRTFTPILCRATFARFTITRSFFIRNMP